MTISFCTFHVGYSPCGIPVDQVLEVADEHTCTPVPLADPSISGLINLRGQIVTAIHLDYLLAKVDEEASTPTPSNTVNAKKNVIVKLGDEKYSLLVDDVGPVMTATTDMIEPVPSNMVVRANEMVTGLARMPSCIVLMLDLSLLSPTRLQVS
jgi:purine-binding chemotaxis protein CheW